MLMRTTQSHIEWHVEAGLTATLLEAPDHLPGHLTVPNDHIAACRAAGTPTVGNAAGNDANWLDLAGEATAPAQYDYG